MRAVAAAVAIVALVTGSCSSGKDAATTTSSAAPRITAEQASRLADVLVANHDAGGARVRATIPYGVGRFDLAGEIDWVAHVGRVTVTATVDGADRPPFEVVFNPSVTFEEVPGLDEAMTARGRPGVDHVARPLDPSTSELHRVLRLIETASSTQRDNPVLLQSAGITSLGRKEIVGAACDGFDQGNSTIWVGVDDGRSHGIDAELSASRTTAEIRFDDFGPRTIEVPVDSRIVSIDEVADLYQELVNG